MKECEQSQREMVVIFDKGLILTKNKRCIEQQLTFFSLPKVTFVNVWIVMLSFKNKNKNKKWLSLLKQQIINKDLFHATFEWTVGFFPPQIRAFRNCFMDQHGERIEQICCFPELEHFYCWNAFRCIENSSQSIFKHQTQRMECQQFCNMFQWYKVKLCDAFGRTFHVILILFASIFYFYVDFLALVFASIPSLVLLCLSILCLYLFSVYSSCLTLSPIASSLSCMLQHKAQHECNSKYNLMGSATIKMKIFCCCQSNARLGPRLVCVSLWAYIDVSFYCSHQAHKRFTNINTTALD